MSASLIDGTVIAITAELVATHGPLDAIILQQVHYWSGRSEGGWARRSYVDWSEVTGLSRDQVKRALLRLVGGDHLESRKGGDDPRDQTLEYRLHPESALCIGRNRPTPQGESARGTRAESPSVPLLEEELEVTQDLVPAGADDAARLCEHLAQRIFEHRGKYPKQNAAWLRDADLLLRRGELGVADPEPWSLRQAVVAIDAVFDLLATPQGSGGFCWADQVQSPGGLRQKWGQIELQARRAVGRHKSQSRDDVLAEYRRKKAANGN